MTEKEKAIMDKKPIYTGTPVPGAPYTPGIVTGNLMFVSGQIPMKPDTKEVIREDFEAEVRQCFTNLEAVLTAAGATLDNCVKVVVFLKDMNNFDRLNKIYNDYFNEIKPARSCIEVAGLPLDVDVEIEAIAAI